MNTVAIDRFGRVHIPKQVREHLKLHEGQELELSVEAGKMILKPNVTTKMTLVDGFPVFDVKGQNDLEDAISWSRKERDPRL
jgi:AbrB family looped-hinge helix DNA binding protein